MEGLENKVDEEVRTDSPQGGEGQGTPSPDGQTDEQQEEILSSVTEEAMNAIGLRDIDESFYQLPENVEFDTPEGIEYVIRRSIDLGRQMAIDEEIKADPLMLQIYTHVKNGGTLDNIGEEVLIPYDINDVSGNVDLQKQVVKEHYKSLGLSDGEITNLINMAINSEQLQQRAVDLANNRNTSIQQKVESRNREIIQTRQEHEAYLNEMDSRIQRAIQQNTFSPSIKIADTKVNEFYQSIVDSVVVDGKESFYVIPIKDEASLNEILTIQYRRLYDEKNKAQAPQQRRIQRPTKVETTPTGGNNNPTDKFDVASHFKKGN